MRFLQRNLVPLLALNLFCLVVGAKWATFHRYGSPMPDWDQWDAEAVESLLPWLKNDEFIKHLLNPHNEHRVVLTKLQNLALTLWNGQWDARLEAASNAVLHAVLSVVFWLAGRRWIRGAPAFRRPRPDSRPDVGAPFLVAVLSAALFVLSFALFGLPVAWQNVLGGFHSQQYWLLLLAFATMTTVPFVRPWSGWWWMGVVSGFLGLGSMGSGFLAAAVVLVVLGWRVGRRGMSWAEAAPGVLCMLIIVSIGLLTRVEAPWHDNLKATGVSDFALSIYRSLMWPWREKPWAAVVMWLPWTVLAWRVWRGAPAPAQAILALGGWVLVQLAATAYARGVGADYPASRYMDTLAFGTMANGVALAWLVRGPGTKDEGPRTGTRAARRSLVLLSLAWVLTLGVGIHVLLADTVRWELKGAREYYDKAEGNMRRYLATNDPKELVSPDIPYPSREGLVEKLEVPHLRALMPAPIRAPIDVTAGAETAGFAENDARRSDPSEPPRAGLSPATSPLDHLKTWGSYGEGPRDQGTKRPKDVQATDAMSSPLVPSVWRSAPLPPPRHGWLKFETAGHLGNPNGGVALELRSAASDTLLANVQPSRVPGDAWRSAYVRAPREPFVIVARDTHPARWLAFSAPVEVASGSYWAWRGVKHGAVITLCATAATLALAAFAGWQHVRARTAGPGAS